MNIIIWETNESISVVWLLISLKLYDFKAIIDRFGSITASDQIVIPENSLFKPPNDQFFPNLGGA